MEIRTWHFIVAMIAGWLRREQEAVIEYLKEENKVLREQLGTRRLRFTDAQRRRLARKGKVVGGRGLRVLDCIVTPETILRWYRQLVAKKYDGSRRRGPGRPRTVGEIQALVLSLAVENPSWGYTRIRDVLRSLGHCHQVGNTLNSNKSLDLTSRLVAHRLADGNQIRQAKGPRAREHGDIVIDEERFFGIKSFCSLQ